MNQVINVGFLLTIIIEYVSFFYIIFRKELRSNFKKYAIWGGVIVLFLLYGRLVRTEISSLLSMGLVMSVFTVYIIFEVSIIDTIKLYLVALPVLFIEKSIVAHIFKSVLIMGEIERTVICIVCIITGLWLYYIIFGRKLDSELFQMSGSIWMIISGIMFLIVGRISYFTCMLTEMVHIKAERIGILLVAVGMVIFILNYMMLYYFNIKQKYRLNIDILEQYNEQQREYFEQLLQKEQSTRQFRHDIISDLLQIQNFCKRKDFEEVEQYISEMLKDISITNKKEYEVGNEIINTMLNSYLAPVRTISNIKVKGVIDNELKVSKRDLCIIVSNLVKNAVEAIENSSKELKEIVFEINQGKQFLHIKVKNTAERETILLKNNIPVTSKKDKQEHGMGIKNIMAVAKKYKGKYKYKIEEGYYIAEVYLQM